MQKIAVLGAGSWGLALSLVLNENHHDVTVWCFSEKEKEDILAYRENKRCLPGIKIPLEIKLTTSLEEAVADQDIVVTAVPSKAIRQTIHNAKPYLEEKTVIVNVSKGLERGTCYRLSEVIQDEVDNKVVVLTGPSHAEEVARHMPTTVVASCIDEQCAKYVQDVFMTEALRVYTNTDMIGVELGGALKNVIALAAGVVEGLGYGDNTKAALMTRGISEMMRLGTAMGGDPSTFAGLTGIGDLIVTCTSGHSRNRHAGELIGQGYSLEEATEKVNMVVEGIPATEAAYELKNKYQVEMPIIETIYKGLFESISIKEAVTELMNREKKMETFEA